MCVVHVCVHDWDVCGCAIGSLGGLQVERVCEVLL